MQKFWANGEPILNFCGIKKNLEKRDLHTVHVTSFGGPHPFDQPTSGCIRSTFSCLTLIKLFFGNVPQKKNLNSLEMSKFNEIRKESNIQKNW